jgi:hypothetical protein
VLKCKLKLELQHKLKLALEYAVIAAIAKRSGLGAKALAGHWKGSKQAEA